MEDVTELVRRWLHEKFPTLSQDKWKPTGKRVWISTDMDKQSFNTAVEAAFPQWVGAVQDLSLFEDVMAKMADTISQNATPLDQQETTLRPSKTEQLKVEFTWPYCCSDAAPLQLESFVVQCWRAFCEENEDYSLPYTTIVQSAGFGKSRLLSELAHRTKDTQGEDAHMRVLYTCVRDDSESSNAFPKATVRLRDYFFPRRGNEATLGQRLCCLYDYAMSQWDTIGNDWIGLFTEQRVDASVHATISSCALSPQASVNATSTVSCDIERKRRILVFAVDDACALHKPTEYVKHGWFRRLQRALATANKKISATYGRFAGIFAILVDATATKSDAVLPSARLDDSSRGSDNESIVFPPFVLTHTMDIMFDSLFVKAAQTKGTDSVTFYQQLVVSGETSSELSLVSMGRPLWKSCYERLGFNGVIHLAAEKLLGGFQPSKVESFNKDTMHGVASLLCRVGIRPLSSSSTFASRVVSDFMAVLSYVSASTGHFISLYASEPVLAFGAARVWYRAAVHGDDHEMLHQHILPELRKLLYHEAVDSRDSGVLVARIILLLAMDTVGVLHTGTRAGRYYAGEFRSVWAFLSVLHGGNETVVMMNMCGEDVTTEASRELEALKTKWGGWHVGFSHFVQLTTEPNEACLWSMLARRAAGLLPREFEGVDLIIPIFKGTEISMILVHVTNRPDGDHPSSFPSTASTLMRPKSVFTGEPFKRKTSGDVIRIYMNLCSRRKPQRFFLVDPGDRLQKSRATSNTTRPDPDADPEPMSLVLCLQGLAAWTVQTETHKNVVFLSEQVAKALTELLDPWGQPMALVKADLATPARRFVDPIVTQTQASRAMVESLVEGKWLRVQTSNHEQVSRSTEEIEATAPSGRKRTLATASKDAKSTPSTKRSKA